MDTPEKAARRVFGQRASLYTTSPSHTDPQVLARLRSVPDDDFVDACMNQLDRYDDESHIREYRPDEWRQMLETGSFLVDTVEPYTKHRPLTSLTDGVSPENLRKIQTRLDHLNARQRAALNLVEIDGQPHLNWYVLIAAKRA